jgi:hypothetical protein
MVVAWEGERDKHQKTIMINDNSPINSLALLIYLSFILVLIYIVFNTGFGFSLLHPISLPKPALLSLAIEVFSSSPG